MLSKSNKAKIKEGRGKGNGANYLPWLTTSEVSSVGTCSNPIDWKTGRTVELLSQGEAYFWHILRWNDSVVDIREQYPLELEMTLKICDEFGVKHPHNRNTYMTSDFYVTYIDGTEKIFSIKPSNKVMDNRRTKEKLSIESIYWKQYRNIDYEIIFKEDMNIILAENIRFVCAYYDRNKVFDKASMLKHLIATKKIKADMELQKIHIPTLLVEFEEKIEREMNLHEFYR